MDRKKFLKNILITGVAGTITPQIIKKAEQPFIASTYD